MIKILKNTTGSPVEIKDTGVTVPASGQYTLVHQDYLLWSASDDIVPLIANGVLVVNDGNIDHSPRTGLAYIQMYDRPSGVIQVKKNPGTGDFSSINDAFDNVSGIREAIEVYPGNYTVDNSSGPIQVPEFWTIDAKYHGTVLLTPTDPDQSMFSFSHSSSRLRGFAIDGVTGNYPIVVDSAPLPVVLDYITMTNCKGYISATSTDTKTQIVLRNVRLISGSSTTNFMNIESVSGLECVARIYNAIFTDDNGSSFEDGISVSGSGARLDPNGLLMRSSVGAGIGMDVIDGGEIVLTSGSEIVGFDTGIRCPNIGQAPILRLMSASLDNVTNDFNIIHPDTEGYVVCSHLKKEKLINNSFENLTLSYVDHHTGDYNNTRILAVRGFATDLTTYATSNSVQQIISFDAHTVVATGSVSGFVLQLPDATTIRNGHSYWVINEATVNVTVRQFGGSNSVALIPKNSVRYTLRDNSTQAGVWSRSVSSNASVIAGATPNFIFSKAGGASTGTYLRTGEAQTDRTGQLIKGNNYIIELALSNDSNRTSTTRVQLQRRTAVSTFVDIDDAWVDIPPGTYKASRSNLQIQIGPDEEISAYVKSGQSMTDPVLVVYITPQ